MSLSGNSYSPELGGLLNAALRLWKRITERRGDERHGLPRLILDIEDHAYETIDWSLSGFRIGPFHRPLDESDRVRLRIVGGIKSMRPRQYNAQVARIMPNGDIGFHVGVPAWESALAMNSIRGW